MSLHTTGTQVNVGHCMNAGEAEKDFESIQLVGDWSGGTSGTVLSLHCVMVFFPAKVSKGSGDIREW